MQRNYKIDLTKCYKIWFSANPYEFLGIENELRLVTLRDHNPDLTISLVYSSNLLNETAQAKLTVFCQRYRIIPVDLDTTIKSWLIDENDQAVFAIAREELEMAVSQRGGNLGAAADCTRLIKAVIEKLGFYSDFDVDFKFSKDTSSLTAQAPVIFNCELAPYREVVMEFNVNTDFLAFGCHDNVPNQLSADAASEITAIQKELIHRYRQPFNRQTLFTEFELMSPELPRAYLFVIDQFLKSDAQKDIFHFRKYLFEYAYPGATAEQVAHLQRKLYEISVISMSGPRILRQLYIDLHHEENKKYALSGVVPMKPEIEPYINMMRASCLSSYPVLSKHIIIKNTQTLQKKHAKHGNVLPGVLADLSWTPSGKSAKAQREEKLNRAIKNTCRIFREKIDSDSAFFIIAKPMCSSSILSALKLSDFNLMLRRASHEGNLRLVELLIKWKDKLCLDFDSTTSKGLTALALAESGGLTAHKEIARLLRNPELYHRQRPK